MLRSEVEISQFFSFPIREWEGSNLISCFYRTVLQENNFRVSDTGRMLYSGSDSF